MSIPDNVFHVLLWMFVQSTCHKVYLFFVCYICITSHLLWGLEKVCMFIHMTWHHTHTHPHPRAAGKSVMASKCSAVSIETAIKAIRCNVQKKCTKSIFSEWPLKFHQSLLCLACSLALCMKLWISLASYIWFCSRVFPIIVSMASGGGWQRAVLISDPWHINWYLHNVSRPY